MIGELVVSALNYPGSIFTIVVVLLVGMGMGEDRKQKHQRPYKGPTNPKPAQPEQMIDPRPSGQEKRTGSGQGYRP